MANVKITDLTELSAADSAAADVFPIVDIDADATKKITIASLRTAVAFANDFVTYTNITANLDIVQDNVAATVTESTAVEARRVANIAGAVSTITTGNLDTGRAIISDGSGKVAISDVTSTEIGYLDGVTSAIQTQLDTKISTADSASNDFVTYTQLNANINLVQDNVVSASGGATGVEARRVANIAGAVSTITTGNLTASRALVSDGSGKVAALASVTSTELAFLDATSSVQTQLDTKIATTASASNDFVTYTQLDANIDVVSANAAAVETKRVANIAGAVSSITTADLTASRAVVSDGSGKVAVSAVTATEIGYLDGVSSAIQTQLDTKGTTTEDTAIEARRAANIAGAVSTITTGNLTTGRAIISDGSGKVAISPVTSTEIGYLDGVTSAIQTQLDTKIATTTSAANDFVTYTNITANVDIVQDNVAATVTETTAVEARRVANIAGAVSTITTGNLTASKALVSDGSGKVSASAVTATEIGYVDGVTSAIQTQLNDIVTRASANTSGDTAAAVESRRVANIAGAVSTITTGNLTASRALVSDGSGKVAISDVTATEIGYLDGVSSAIQTQINSKQATITGAATTIDDADLTASRALVSDGSGKVAVSVVTSTEIGYLDGVSSAIQTQLNTKAPLAGATFTGQVNMSDDLVVTGNLTVNGETTTVNSENKVIQDRFIMLANAVSGAPTADVGIFFNRGTSGNAAIFYDESAKFFTLSETRDPDSNIAVSPTGAANLSVGQFTATSVKYNGADLNTAITDNRSGAVSTVYKDNLTASRAMVSDGSGKIAISVVTATEIGYLDGVTSAIQTQINSKQATITGAATTIDDTNLTASRAMVSDGSGKVAISVVTATEIGYLDGVSSAIQTQIDSKQATITGAATTIDDADLTASRAVVSDGSGKVAASAVTATELGYVDGVTSAIQTQLDAKAALAGADFTGAVSITNNSTDDSFLITSTEASATAAPVFTMKRNSGSPTDGDYLGQLKFKGENDADQEVIYAKMTGKISDASDGTEDGLLEFTLKKDGSNNIGARLTSTDLKLLNGTGLDVEGTTNLDVVDIDGAVQLDATLTIGANDQGYDVILYGDTASANMTWDTSADDLIFNGGAGLIVPDGQFTLGSTAVTSTATELNYVDGVTSAIQTQINSKQATITGAATTIDDTNLTASRAMVSDGSGKVAISVVTATEVGYLDGVTSAIQTQLNAATARINSNAEVAASNTAAVEARRVANIAGAVSTITTGNLTASRAMVSDGSGKVAISVVTATEIGYLDGVTSAIQTQINSKQATITGAATTIDDTNLTASKALVSDGSGKVAVSAVTSTEIGYLDGVTSAIQTQINSKQATITGAATTIDDTNLTASRALVSSGSGKVAVSAVTSTEIEFLDGVTAGTVVNGKVVAYGSAGQLAGTSLAVAADADINGNLVIGTNASNTLTIVGTLDLGAL